MTPDAPRPSIRGDRGEGGLQPRHWSWILSILSRHPEVEAAALFGSRAHGAGRPGSDIDLWVEGPRMEWRVVASIREALEESHLPFFVDVVHLTPHTEEGFAERVRRDAWPIDLRPGAVLSEAREATATS